MSKQRWTVRPEGSNWGEFGDEDQLGRMNLLTDRHRLAAIQEVRDGKVFPLGIPLDFPGGNAVSRFRRGPRMFSATRADGHFYNFGYDQLCACFRDVVSDDSVHLFTHYSTHWDALAHIGQIFDADGDGKAEKVYYNGYRAGTDIVGPLRGEEGPRAHRLGIENFAAAGVQGRGVLVNLFALFGRTRELVGYDTLMRALDGQGATVETGDFLCLYTGWTDLMLEMNRQPDGDVLGQSCSVLNGRDGKLLQWITDSGIVAICADNFAVEGYPAPPVSDDSAPHTAHPLHEHCIFKLGVYLGELWYFAHLAAWLGERKRFRFLLTAPPLCLPGGVGSPVTPLATV